MTVLRTIDRTVSGTPDDVAATLARIEASGLLVSGTLPARRADGTVAVVVRLKCPAAVAGAPAQRATGTIRARERWSWQQRCAVVAVVCLLALPPVVAALAFIVIGSWLVAHWALALVCLVALLALGGTAARHCPGCPGV
jgi:hypothetical protein